MSTIPLRTSKDNMWPTDWQPKGAKSEMRHFIKMLIFQQNFAHTVIHLINLKRDNFRARSSGWMRVDGQHPLKLPGVARMFVIIIVCCVATVNYVGT